jgi:hypothetical protein
VSNTKLKNIALTTLMMLGGLGCGLLLILLLIRLLPQFEPGGQRFVFTDYDGDTFRHQPGLVRPPSENRLLEDVTRFDDADGFRRPLMIADTYPIIAIGDSFTDGGQVPWTDRLATALDTPVRNLGWSGFGPLEYVEVMKQYGGDDHQWVLVMFFEGNDLSNIKTTYEKAQTNGGVVELNLNRTIGAPITDVRNLDDYTDITLNDEDRYLYPLTHTRPDGSTFEMAYISDYLWWLNGGRRAYRESNNTAQLGTALQTIKAEAGDACVALVYAPTKEHIYFKYADPEGNRRYVLENALTLIRPSDGWLSFRQEAVDFETLWGRIDHQREAVTETAQSAGLQVIDLVPAFEEAALSGDLAYYPYDSHWSSRGHQTAADAIADYIRQHPCQ